MRNIFLSLMVVSCGVLCSPIALSESNDEEIVEEAWASIEGFFEAFNEGDNDALQDYVTYPHLLMMRNGGVRIEPERLTFDFEAMKKNQDWVKSTMDSHEVTMVFPDKVHFRIVFSRHNSKGERYLTMEGIYIATKKDGKWGLQVRSY